MHRTAYRTPVPHGIYDIASCRPLTRGGMCLNDHTGTKRILKEKWLVYKPILSQIKRVFSQRATKIMLSLFKGATNTMLSPFKGVTDTMLSLCKGQCCLYLKDNKHKDAPI